MTFILWCILLVLCWPIALLALVLYPLIWLLLLPFRIVGIAVGGVLDLVRAVIMLPARILRHAQKRVLNTGSASQGWLDSNDLAFRVHINACSAGNFGQARHKHHVAGNRDHKTCASGERRVSNIERPACGST